MISRVLIIGVGLLGTSLGLALKQRSLAQTIFGVDPSQHHLETALKRKAIDLGETDLASVPLLPDNHPKPAEHSTGPDELAIVCTPVSLIAPTIFSLARWSRKRPLLITDVGSTKASIQKEVGKKLPQNVRFIGSHPIAGSEQSGPSSASAELFSGALTVLTPTEEQLVCDVTFLEFFWNALGSTVIQISPEYHDRILARTSHFPHLLATLLVRTLQPGDHLLVGSGFRSTSRLASGDSRIWRDIFLDNRNELLKSMDRFEQLLEEFRKILEQQNPDELELFLGQSKQWRDALEKWSE